MGTIHKPELKKRYYEEIDSTDLKILCDELAADERVKYWVVRPIGSRYRYCVDVVRWRSGPPEVI